MSVYILASRKYTDEPYIDDVMVQKALNERGIECHIVCWQDKLMASEGDVIINRSCWDYPQHLEEFLKQIECFSKQARMLNSYELMSRNYDKTYLLDLEKQGFPVTPSAKCESLDDVKSAIKKVGLPAICKPTVSASGIDTLLLNEDNFDVKLQEIEEIFTRKSAVLIQPFIEEIQTVGERSILVIDGEAVGCIKKLPKAGSHLANGHQGGSADFVPLNDEDLKFTGYVLSKLSYRPNFMRIDTIPTADGYKILELEMIEPCLYLDRQPKAFEVMVNMLTRIHNDEQTKEK